MLGLKPRPNVMNLHKIGQLVSTPSIHICTQLPCTADPPRKGVWIYEKGQTQLDTWINLRFPSIYSAFRLIEMIKTSQCLRLKNMFKWCAPTSYIVVNGPCIMMLILGGPEFGNSRAERDVDVSQDLKDRLAIRNPVYHCLGAN